MCCLNVPYTLALWWIWSNPYTEDDMITCTQRLMWPFVVLLTPITVVLDIITFPLHMINVLIRRYRRLPIQGDYVYDYICGVHTRYTEQPLMDDDAIYNGYHSADDDNISICSL
jgi:hypothetical protein